MSDETVILPDAVQPGDIIECHGMRQRVTFEKDTVAIEQMDQGVARYGFRAILKTPNPR